MYKFEIKNVVFVVLVKFEIGLFGLVVFVVLVIEEVCKEVNG